MLAISWKRTWSLPRPVAPRHLRQQTRHRNLTPDAGRVPVTALVAGLRLDTLQSCFSNLIHQIDAEEIDRAARAHALADRLEIGFVRLRQIGCDAHDLDAVFGQPVCDGAAVQPARGGEGDGLALEVGDVHGESLICHSERSEESEAPIHGHETLRAGVNMMQILRCAQDDNDRVSYLDQSRGK
jgi:hypothetical protein